MKTLVCTIAFAATFAAAPVFAQDTPPTPPPAPQDATASASATPAGLPAAPQPMAYKAVPFVDIAVGFTYLQSDLTDLPPFPDGAPGGYHTYQLGWYGMPQVDLTRHISVLADFSNYNNWHAGQTDNYHTFMGGPAYTLGKFHGFVPFGFVEAGAIRESNDGAINWNTAASGGFGMNMKLTKALSFQVIPGQYIAEQLPNGNWQSDYVAKAGFVLNTFRWARMK